MSNWISVSDSLPPEGEWVVAQHRQKRPFTCRLFSRIGVLGHYPEWLDADNLTRDPTHWAALPTETDK